MYVSTDRYPMRLWVMQTRTGSHRDDITPLRKQTKDFPCGPFVFIPPTLLLSSSPQLPSFSGCSFSFEFRGETERVKKHRMSVTHNEYEKAQTTGPTSKQKTHEPKPVRKKGVPFFFVLSLIKASPFLTHRFRHFLLLFICFACPPLLFFYAI